MKPHSVWVIKLDGVPLSDRYGERAAYRTLGTARQRVNRDKGLWERDGIKYEIVEYREVVSE